ncbi:TPA: restriction endonuclease subunit S [Vibrio vulnificus]|uniref:restriction endonuclease subunit S n=1 Tax=Vibrio vulnificus TaxID=672 RepID=UPI000CD0DA34|nr:restriction endonuclease subunit S [Vibrio vulnificus]POB15806.1 restriction endonuclease subunit S [Vibrio vulnificus]HDY7989228.1 restriction endonuclease subunit S [Vibrio vulnificus]
MIELPKGWVVSKIDALCRKPEQIKPEDTLQFKYIDISSVDRHKKEVVSPTDMLGSDAPSRARKLVNAGDVIVSMTRPNLNAVAKIPKHLEGNIASTGFDVLKPVLIEPDWLFSVVKSKSFIDSISGTTIGALYPACKASDIRGYEMPVPPLAEQKRIVEKLDEVLAQVDTIKARLDGIPAILKRFRQSVLASAVSGKLTVSEAPRQMSCLKKLGKIAGGKTPSKAKSVFWNGDVLWVSPKDMKTDFIDDSLDRISELAISEGGMKYVPENSLLMVTRSGILAHTFPVALATKKLTINQDIKAFTPDTNLILPEFGLYLIKGLAPRILAECSKTGTTVASVETKLLESMEFELPTIKEQQEIVRLVDQYFAFADTIEAQVKKAQARVDNLTQSILAKAFRGELVPQDPNDEPADKLLERIAQARKEAEALAKAAKKAQSTKSMAKKKVAKSV